jgi:hypothetical protein
MSNNILTPSGQAATNQVLALSVISLTRVQVVAARLVLLGLSLALVLQKRLNILVAQEVPVAWVHRVLATL